MNEGEVYFGLFGMEFDPSIALEQISIDWALTKYNNDPIPKRSSWRCSTGKIQHQYVDVYEMSSVLISKIAPHTKEINEVKKRLGLDAVLQVVLTISTDDEQSTPAIGFDRDVLSFVQTVGATIDIDTYLRS